MASKKMPFTRASVGPSHHDRATCPPEPTTRTNSTAALSGRAKWPIPKLQTTESSRPVGNWSRSASPSRSRAWDDGPSPPQPSAARDRYRRRPHPWPPPRPPPSRGQWRCPGIRLPSRTRRHRGVARSSSPSPARRSRRTMWATRSCPAVRTPETLPDRSPPSRPPGTIVLRSRTSSHHRRGLPCITKNAVEVHHRARTGRASPLAAVRTVRLSLAGRRRGSETTLRPRSDGGAGGGVEPATY